MAARLLALGGWHVEGDVPPLDKAVLVIAPHTSNWDFIVLVLAKFTLGLKVRFIGKHTLFVGPFGWWLRSMGGIPVDRHRPGGIVDDVVAEMLASDRMYFALAPEGTRKLSPGWKTGFWRVASKVGAPIVPVIIDAGTRSIRMGVPVDTSGDMAADFDQLALAYAGVRGIRSELAAPVRPI